MVLGVVLSLYLRDGTGSCMYPSVIPVNRSLHIWRHILIVAAISYEFIICFANALMLLWSLGTGGQFTVILWQSLKC